MATVINELCLKYLIMDNTTTNVQGREIRFRAWHKEQRIMAKVGDLNWSGDIHVSYKSGPEKPGYFFGGNNVGANWKKDEHILMQFTGLRDKSGKEVYEGDIVKCQDHPTGTDNVTGVVTYHHGAFMIPGSMLLLRDYGTAWTEVIGNLYEHPHLLKTEGIIAEGLIDHGDE